MMSGPGRTIPGEAAGTGGTPRMIVTPGGGAIASLRGRWIGCGLWNVNAGGRIVPVGSGSGCADAGAWTGRGGWGNGAAASACGTSADTASVLPCTGRSAAGDAAETRAEARRRRWRWRRNRDERRRLVALPHRRGCHHVGARRRMRTGRHNGQRVIARHARRHDDERPAARGERVRLRRCVVLRLWCERPHQLGKVERPQHRIAERADRRGCGERRNAGDDPTPRHCPAESHMPVILAARSRPAGLSPRLDAS
jgi:hypothetical protein